LLCPHLPHHGIPPRFRPGGPQWRRPAGSRHGYGRQHVGHVLVEVRITRSWPPVRSPTFCSPIPSLSRDFLIIIHFMAKRGMTRSIHWHLFGALLLVGACGKHSGLPGGGTGGATAVSSGGAIGLGSGGNGGIMAASTGGTTSVASGGAGGATAIPSGGTKGPATGGTAGHALAGASGTATGGTTNLPSGSTGGVPATGGSSGTLACDGVICQSLPASCKMIVQAPDACCPVCTDTGCDPCPEIACGAGMHKETAVGACCPTCLADPPDPCTQGQQSYAALRAQLLDKYSSSTCKNSTDCNLVFESNACTAICNVPLPTGLVNSYQTNLESTAKNACATCPTPAPAQCELLLPACMNGKCVAANPS
jgi:hypothetical protein